MHTYLIPRKYYRSYKHWNHYTILYNIQYNIYTIFPFLKTFIECICKYFIYVYNLLKCYSKHLIVSLLFKLVFQYLFRNLGMLYYATLMDFVRAKEENWRDWVFFQGERHYILLQWIVTKLVRFIFLRLANRNKSK